MASNKAMPASQTSEEQGECSNSLKSKTMLKTNAATTDDGRTELNTTVLQMGEDERTVLKTSASLMGECSSADPTTTAADIKTDSGGPDVKSGSLTDQLSDMTDEDDEIQKRTTHTGSLSAFYRYTLLKNPRVRKFALMNLFLIALIILLLLLLILLGVYFIALRIQVYRILRHRSNPCLYRWSEWSACSATCTSGLQSPYRIRTVIRESIVTAHGNHPKCPDNLNNMVDTAPCNLYQCPKPLSSYEDWTKCFYWNATLGPEGGCYKVRVLPRTEQLIRIDTKELYRNCTSHECYNIPF